MGLAVLPPHLKTELEEVEKFLLGHDNKMVDYHLTWAKKLKAIHKNITAGNVREIVRRAVGLEFARALEDAGVYKRTKEGQHAFKRFIDYVNTHC